MSHLITTKTTVRNIRSHPEKMSAAVFNLKMLENLNYYTHKKKKTGVTWKPLYRLFAVYKTGHFAKYLKLPHISL